MKTTKIFLISLFISLSGFSQTAELVKDISSESTAKPQIEKFHRLNATTLLFRANDQIHGYAIWKTDGTEVGTTLVKAAGAWGNKWTKMVNLNSYAYFTAGDALDEKLWRTDGTTAGTAIAVEMAGLVVDGDITQVGGILYFAAYVNTNNSDVELWRSDGTVAGTYVVKNINTTGSSSPKNLIDVNGTLFFTAYDPVRGEELWKSDGTTVGTVFVKDVTPGNTSLKLKNLIAVNNTLFFKTVSGYYEEGPLWKSDGTEAGTTILNSNNLQNVENLTKLNNKLIFSGYDGTSATGNGWQIWQSDGTIAGTQMLKNIFTYRYSFGGGGSFVESARPRGLVAVNNQVFFVADTTRYSAFISLWKTDGTTAGTTLVKKFDSDPENLANVNGTLFFACGTIYDTDHELWKSDGTETGTILVKDIYPGAANGTEYKYNLSGPGNFTFFEANDGVNGLQLWKSDGSLAGTTMVKKIDQSTISSVPIRLVDVNGTLFFSSSFTEKGLWKSNGTSAGTELVSAGQVYPFANVNGTLFLSKYTNHYPNSKFSLWKSNSTTAGTTEVKNVATLYSFNNYISPFDINICASFNGLLFFWAYLREASGSDYNLELWKSDGTEAGTVLVKDINPGDNSAFPGNNPNFFAFNNALYFVAYTPANGQEIWKTDGTEAGTVLLKDINVGTGDITTYLYYDLHFTTLNGYLYFLANDGGNNVQFWRTDGTTAGTIRITNAADHTALFRHLVNVNGTLFLSDGSGNIWKSNGTAGGTVLVKNGFDSGSMYLTNVGNKLFFFGSNGGTGRELWKSDGTEAGTVLVKDINPGTDASVSDQGATNIPPVVLNGVFYFVATNPTSGVELWRSDGTEQGTQTFDIFQGAKYYGNGDVGNSSNPQYLTISNNTLFFSAENIKGRELWKVTAPCTQMVSVKTGNWTDPTVWTCNRAPATGDVVTVAPGHVVAIGAGVVGVCKTVQQQGQLVFGTGGRLQLGQN